MRTASRSGVGSAFRWVSAAIVSSLLIFFAVGAKLAWYYPSQSASHNLSSIKIWVQKASPSAVQKAPARNAAVAPDLHHARRVMEDPFVRPEWFGVQQLAFAPPAMLPQAAASIRPPPVSPIAL
jgi:hypothetical protein